MFVDVRLAVFWNTFVVLHSFGETNKKKNFFEKKFLKSNFHPNFSVNGNKVVYPADKH